MCKVMHFARAYVIAVISCHNLKERSWQQISEVLMANIFYNRMAEWTPQLSIIELVFSCQSDNLFETKNNKQNSFSKMRKDDHNSSLRILKILSFWWSIFENSTSLKYSQSFCPKFREYKRPPIILMARWTPAHFLTMSFPIPTNSSYLVTRYCWKPLGRIVSKIFQNLDLLRKVMGVCSLFLTHTMCGYNYGTSFSSLHQ